MEKQKTYHFSTTAAGDSARMQACFASIKEKVATLCGVDRFIEKDGWVAFSGTAEKPALQLTLTTMKTGGKLYLYADVDDEISWQEWDYDSAAEFEDEIVSYIAPMVNRIVKIVTEKKKHTYMKISRYYLDGGKWVLIDEETEDFRLLRMTILKDSYKETIREYRL